MRAYILRSFGTKDGINFDRVEQTLIRPALAQLAIDAYSESYSGNVQNAIFVQLATADLVVADVSSTSPAINFELGVRYTIRDRFTVLLQAQNRPPNFHLRQLRMLWYNPEDPSAFVMELVAMIQDRIRGNSADSPVYMAVPGMQPPSFPELQSAPRSFRDEVARASGQRDAGHLALLAYESATLPWRLEALRLIAKAQIGIRDYTSALKSLEVLRSSDPDDIEVNARLGTVYDRLGKATEARMSLDRVLTAPGASQLDRAEALALTARNLKTEWTESWRSAKPEERSLKAFRSPLLLATREAYVRAYKEDLNHYYSGLNALAMTQVQLQLARKHADAWEERFEDEVESAAQLKKEELLAANLAGAVDLSLSSAADIAAREGARDPWVDVSRADFVFLTSKKPQRIGRLYEEALSAADSFARDSVRRQLQMYAELGVFAGTVQSVFGVLGESEEMAPVKTGRLIQRVLLFTGHPIDSPQRPSPRFPADREDVARKAIQQAIATGDTAGMAIGMAGATNGGDILFHEACRQSRIPTELFLPIPEDEYVSQAVLSAGGNWLARFKLLRDSVPVHVLQGSAELPDWLRDRPDYSYWQRSNLWLLNSALACRGASVTLIALWNGAPGEGAGGTMDMISQARAAGVSCVVLNTNQIFGLT